MAIDLGTTVEGEPGGDTVTLTSADQAEPAVVPTRRRGPDGGRARVGPLRGRRRGRGPPGDRLHRAPSPRPCPSAAGCPPARPWRWPWRSPSASRGRPLELAEACQRAEQRASGVPSRDHGPAGLGRRGRGPRPAHRLPLARRPARCPCPTTSRSSWSTPARPARWSAPPTPSAGPRPRWPRPSIGPLRGRRHARPAAPRGPGHRGPGPARHHRERPGVGLRRGPRRGLARRGRGADGRQPRQPARRLRGLDPDTGRPGRAPVGHARRVRRPPHRRRLRRLRRRPHGARRAGRGLDGPPGGRRPGDDRPEPSAEELGLLGLVLLLGDGAPVAEALELLELLGHAQAGTAEAALEVGCRPGRTSGSRWPRSACRSRPGRWTACGCR